MTNIWTIDQLSCYPKVDNKIDVVFSVAWRVNGTDGAFSATIYGTQSIALCTEESLFTPYSNLTKAQVISWVQDAMGAEQVESINTSIKQQIDDQVNPPVVNPFLPWIA